MEAAAVISGMLPTGILAKERQSITDNRHISKRKAVYLLTLKTLAQLRKVERHVTKKGNRIQC